MKFSVKRATFVVVAVLNISELAALTPHHKRFRVSLGTNAPSIARLKPGSVNDKPRKHRRHVGPPKSIVQTSGCVKGCTETRMEGRRQFGDIVSGVFTPVLAKHWKSFSLIDCISVGVDRMQRNFEPMRKQVEAWQRSELTALLRAEVRGVQTADHLESFQRVH